MSGISGKSAGEMLKNKKKYNGIEFENDFDLNSYDAFYRNLDPQIGRWWQIDPKTEKYFCLTPYISMADNPILITDPLGDDLELTGKQKNIDRALVNINKALNGFYTASIDKNGKVQITATDKKGDISKQTVGFYSVLSGVVNNKNGTATIKIVSNSSKVDVDSWSNKKIDIADAEKFGDDKYMSTASILAHSFAEQESLQINNKSNPDRSIAAYFRDHDEGKKAEDIVTGFGRSPSEVDNTRSNIAGNTTGTYRFIYYENASQPISSGSNKYNYHYVDVKFKNGNVKSVNTVE